MYMDRKKDRETEKDVNGERYFEKKQQQPKSSDLHRKDYDNEEMTY